MDPDDGVSAMSPARRQGIVTAVVGVLAAAIGALIVASASAFGAVSGSSLAAAVLQWDVVAWAAIVAVGLAYVGGGEVRRAVAAIAVAPVVAIVSAMLPFGAASSGALLIVAGWKAVTLTSAGAVGAIAGVLDVRRRTAATVPPADPEVSAPSAGSSTEVADARSGALRRRGQILAAAVLVALIAGGALLFALPMGWFAVTFAIWEPADPPTSDEIARYERTALLALFAFVLAVALAAVRRGKGLVIASVVALLIGLGGAFVFQVPPGRFLPPPAPHVVDDDHPVCFGTTGDCPGG